MSIIHHTYSHSVDERVLCTVIVLTVASLSGCVSNENDDDTLADTQEVEPIEIFPGQDIQYIVDNSPAASTFLLKSGIHRMQELWPRAGDTFEGENGTILSGARVLPEFSRSNDLWYSANQTQEGPRHGDQLDPEKGWVCPDEYPRCDRPEDLYFNDEPLLHVGSIEEVASGSWFFDYDNDTIWFADDPQGHSIETSVTYFAFVDSANDVTIRNLVIEKFASWVQLAAVGSSGNVSGWLVEGNEIRLNHGVGVIVSSDSIVRRNHIHHNGQIGVATGAPEGYRVTNVLFEANEISYNNYAHVSCGFECGGAKFTVTDGLVVRGNYVHHNMGPGLWTDIDNTGVIYEDNWIWWNEREGIVHEISHDVIIRNNDLRYNGVGHDIWMWGSQILIHVSDGAQVYGNTLYVHEDTGHGIGIMNYNREEYPDFGDFYGRDNSIHHNDITYLGLYGASGIVDDGEVGSDYYQDSDGDGFADWGCLAESANNLFDYNAYHHDGIAEKFEFCGASYLTWEEFQAEGQEAHGTMDSLVVVPDDTPPDVLS